MPDQTVSEARGSHHAALSRRETKQSSYTKMPDSYSALAPAS